MVKIFGFSRKNSCFRQKKKYFKKFFEKKIKIPNIKEKVFSENNHSKKNVF